MDDLKAKCGAKLLYRRGWLDALRWVVAVVQVNEQEVVVEMIRQKFDEMKSEALKWETPESAVAHELMEE
jgi:hypothetical protein